MPISFDKIGISIITSLLSDVRKSFRQVSRETGITTSTVKARYERLINMGIIKEVMPVFDFDKVTASNKGNKLIRLSSIKKHQTKRKSIGKNISHFLKKEISKIEKRIKKALDSDIMCDLCEKTVYRKDKILKFADIESFYVCTSCKQVIVKNIV